MIKLYQTVFDENQRNWIEFFAFSFMFLAPLVWMTAQIHQKMDGRIQAIVADEAVVYNAQIERNYKRRTEFSTLSLNKTKQGKALATRSKRRTVDLAHVDEEYDRF